MERREPPVRVKNLVGDRTLRRLAAMEERGDELWLRRSDMDGCRAALEEGSVTTAMCMLLAETVRGLEHDSPTPYLAWQARARRHRRGITPLVELFDPRGSCDLVIEVLSYPPSQLLPDPLTTQLWTMIEHHEMSLEDRSERAPASPASYVRSARVKIAVTLLGHDLGTSFRRGVHDPALIDRDNRAMSIITLRTVIRGLLEHLDDPDDLPFVWPERPTAGQLWTPVDNKVGPRCWVPEPIPDGTTESRDVPKSAKSVPEPGDPIP